MKRVVSTLAAIVLIATAVSAQDRTSSLGVRLGAGTAYNGELSLQHWTSDVNRIEMDLGLQSNYSDGGIDYAVLAAVYQWHWTIDGGFGWYAGPGAAASIKFNDPSLGLGLGGQIGLDYQFNAPVQISLDVRPVWNFIGHVSGISWASALGIRYCF